MNAKIVNELTQSGKVSLVIPCTTRITLYHRGWLEEKEGRGIRERQSACLERYVGMTGNSSAAIAISLSWNNIIKYLDVGPQAQLPPPYAEDISALLTMALS